MTHIEFAEKIKRSFGGMKSPVRPFIRNLTHKELEKMRKYFVLYSFSNAIDAEGNIHLGGGEPQESFMFFITEQDLFNLV